MRASTRLALLMFLACGCSRLLADASADTAPEVLYLQAFVNGVDQDVIVRVERRAGDYYLQADDLLVLGLRQEVLPPAAQGLIAMRALAVPVAYSALEQRLDLTVPFDMLRPQLLGTAREEEIEPRSDTGLLFDYGFHLQSNKATLSAQPGRAPAPAIVDTSSSFRVARLSDHANAAEEKTSSLALSTSTRLFSRAGIFINRGYTTFESDEARYVREDTYWTYSELDSMRTWVVGDYIGGSLVWTRALRLAGAQLSRNFGVRPDLVTFALPGLGGTAVVPTTVDLYVNGTRHFSGEAHPGPFLLTDPPPLTGAGEVAIVYRDALGRLVTTRQSLYVDTRMLDAGLSDYHVDIGYPRRNFGSESSSYGDDLEGVASLRHGVTDALTLELHTELSPELRNAGGGVRVGLGRFGTTGIAVSRSEGSHVGTLAAIGYQFITPDWSIILFDRRTHGDYGDLGSLEGVEMPQRLTRASVSRWFRNTHAISVDYIDQRLNDLDISRVLSLSYNGNWLGGRLNTYLSVFRDEENHDDNGAYLTVNISFGGGSSGYSGVSRNGEEQTAMVGASRPVDYDLGGFGWSMAVEEGNDGYQRAHAQLDHRSRFADVAAMLTKTGTSSQDEQWTASLDAIGSLVYMRGGLFATRAIHDGFALVSTRGLADVTVLRENRALGRTNRRGYLLVPDLPSWRSSRIAIDLLQAPVDVSTTRDQMMANPREFSGVVVEFPIERMQGATLVLVDEQGKPLPPGSSVTLLGKDTLFLIGYDGQVFFPDLEKVNRLLVDLPEGQCEVEVPFDLSQVMQTLGPFVCKATP